MNDEILVALIAAVPPSLAAILGYFATKRTIMRSVGTRRGFSLARAIARLDSKVDRIDAKVEAVGEGQTELVRRVARLETRSGSDWRAS